MIDPSLRPTECMPRIILCLWGFLCVKDEGHRGNKITGYHHIIHHTGGGPKRDHHCQEDPSARDKPNKKLHPVVHWVITAIKADNFVWCKELPAAAQM